ncbi:aryl-sulfate sulfotransferase [uncultured Psychroserpens sp.]|uniref:aryl-sulfate sulfotransferase n=1 Tax=uncultured Psychroserpens sp. TaxID=255436 RepID=UPI0026290516|nr:aryl-sulfate sulfotransferase [uncultured Psychroserpens sp.]
MKFITYTILICVSILSFNCKNDDDIGTIDPPDPQLTENVEIYNGNLIDNSYTFAIENGGTASYLLDKAGHKIKEWEFADNLGNDLELLPNGKLLGIFKVEDPDFFFGGYGGKLMIINDDGSVDWEFEYASEDYIAHHDAELLPNGNVLFIAWEKIETMEAQSHGVETVNPIYPEILIEINPQTNEIVWQWRSFEHIIQDSNDTALNFGNVSENPQRIDINYDVIDNGDIMHANSIDYDADNDIIYLSVNYYSEVWVIDHSTTTAEAATNSGGNYNKGGDLLYRFGNPTAYKNTQGTRLFYNNHFPNVIKDNNPGAGHIIVFMNGGNTGQSVIYELEMPVNFNLTPNTDNEPNVVWSFTDPDLFHGRISGAVRLKNGNTLIAEGDYGFWEVTEDSEVVWKYNGLGKNFWRAYNYNLDDQEILDLNLE